MIMVTLTLPMPETPVRRGKAIGWAQLFTLPFALACIGHPLAEGAKPAKTIAPVSAPAAAPISEGVGPLSLPSFSLPDLEGRSISSKDWEGKLVLVDFWATWCADCRQTIPALSRLQDKYGPQG